MDERVKKVYLERLDRYQSSLFYSQENLWSRLVKTAIPLEVEVYSVPPGESLTWSRVRKLPFAPTAVGAAFGPAWSTHWFRVKLQNKASSDQIIWWDCESEAMFYTGQGRPLGAVNDGDRHWVNIKDLLGEEYFYVEMAGVGLGGNATGPIMIAPPNEERVFRLKRADLVEIDP